MSLCGYCGRARSLVQDKKYCKKCSDNMVRECIRCHKPYHSMTYFSSDESKKRCNSCHTKYQKEKKRYQEKSMEKCNNSKKRKDTAVQEKSETGDSSSQSSEEGIEMDAEGKEIPSTSISTSKKKRKKNLQKIETHDISESETENIKTRCAEDNAGNITETESSTPCTKKKNKMKKVSPVAQKKKVKKQLTTKIKPEKKEKGILNVEGKKAIGYIPIFLY